MLDRVLNTSLNLGDWLSCTNTPRVFHVETTWKRKTPICERFINKTRVKWSLSFFSVNVSDIFTSSGWGRGTEIFFWFSKIFFCLKLTFWSVPITSFTYIYDVHRKVTRPLHLHASEIGKPTPLRCKFWTSTLWLPIDPSQPRNLFCLNRILVHFFINCS